MPTGTESQKRGSRGGRTVSAAVIRRVLAFLRPHRRAIAAATACVLVQTLLSLTPFLIIRSLINHLQHPSASFSTVAVLLVAGLALAMLGGLVNVLRTWIVLRITTDIVANVRGRLMDKLLGQSIGYFTATRSGDVMSRVLNDVGQVETVLGESALSFLGNVITVFVCVLAMLVFEWRLALVTLIVLPLVAVALRAGSGAIYRTRREVQRRIAAFTAHAQEVLSLSGIMLVRSFGRQRTERERSRALIDDLRASAMRAGMTARWFGLGLEFVQYTAPLLLLLAGAWLIVHHYASLATVVAFVTVLSFRFAVALAGAGTGAVRLIGVLPSWERLFAVLDSEVEVRDPPDARQLEHPQGAVAFDGVSFRYPGQRRPALHDVSLDVKRGQLVALVGPSGAGKTTLTSLLARFYDPQEGAVTIDGHDLRTLQLNSIAEAIGLVLQETYLFHGTLRENLAYARPQATDQQLEAACRDGHLDHVIAELAEGLDTVVGERGHRLSGGEKQRVAIARVILKDSPILILDEATSHLDSASERLIQDALARLFAGRTSFVIAHRLSTVLAADLIVVLDQGRVVEQGRHDVLVAAGGLYASLYELQFRGRVGEPVTI